MITQMGPRIISPIELDVGSGKVDSHSPRCNPSPARDETWVARRDEIWVAPDDSRVPLGTKGGYRGSIGFV